jgi:hypothetical protein
MDKRKLSLLLKRNIKKIQNKDLYEYLDNFGSENSDLSLNTKIQINNFEKSLIDIRDLKKMLGFLSSLTRCCSFIVSRDHLFYSGSDKNSDFSTYKKLEVYQKTLEQTSKLELIKVVKDKTRLHELNILVDPKISQFQIEDSLLIGVKLPNSNLYLGFLGNIDSDFDLQVAIFKYLANSPTFNERLSRMFN